MSDSSNAQTIGGYVDSARESGAVKIDTQEGEYYVVALQQRKTGVPAPFDGAEELLKPPLKRAAYSDRTAWLMAALSELAYTKFESQAEVRADFTARLADAGLMLHSIYDEPNTGTQAFIARRPDSFTVLAFRGTEKDRKDILTDLNARFYNTPTGRAHQGFAMAYEGIRKDIVSDLRELQQNDQLDRLFVTGHSLGGALATVAACNLEKEFLVAACYTFGSPRVGTAEWSDAVKTPVYRIVNGADGVPLVPLSSLTRGILLALPTIPLLGWLNKPVHSLLDKGYAGFQHAGDFRFVKGQAHAARLKIGSAAAWERVKHVVWGKFIGAFKRLSPKALSSSFSDHSISEYEAKLRKIAEDRN
ncbi:lipase family protein [Thiohalomonas denitrificans]|uniref:lipase family protein n=1 Tax=Thiohalomonas denitrificans TaxID=415747 RepID=UPI0026EC14C5|nr:lipase family protein [Thiohalomonas denitrificans]